jgi:uncharacterized metal-binding protein YceD (DUF177 family)
VKIHLKQIPAEGLHLEGEENCPIADMEAEGIRCAGALHYNLDVGISADSLWATGSLTQPMELQCVSCLEKFVQDVKVPGFSILRELRGPETIDLTPLMREELLLNLPPYPHCDAEGSRQCKAPAIGDTTQLEKAQRAAKREHDWGALDKLKVKRANP